MSRPRRTAAGRLREGSARYGSGKSTVSSQGQVTIPKHIRERYGLTPGARVEFDSREEGVLLRPKKTDRHPAWDAIGTLKEGWRWPSGVPHTVDAYIDYIRGGSYEQLTGRKTRRRRHK
jgi:AbrB family looped-hinge helix DNA binding protein